MPTPVIPAPPPLPGALDPPWPGVALCEPDASLRMLLSEWLQRAKLEPLPCDAAETGARVVLVIADVQAPRRDGAARIARLRQRFPGAKVLAISAQFMPAMCGATAAAVELGADAVLAKPFAVKLFVDAVRALTGL